MFASLYLVLVTLLATGVLAGKQFSLSDKVARHIALGDRLALHGPKPHTDDDHHTAPLTEKRAASACFLIGSTALPAEVESGIAALAKVVTCDTSVSAYGFHST